MNIWSNLLCYIHKINQYYAQLYICDVILKTSKNVKKKILSTTLPNTVTMIEQNIYCSAS